MRIALIGYGKMGKMIEEIADDRGHDIVLKIHTENIEEFTKENLSKVDVAIEFTSPHSAPQNVMKCLEWNIPIVCGSTGWNDKLEEAKQFCQAKGGSFLHASNLSIGVNIFFQVNQALAKMMASQESYNVQLKEIHHTQKLDAPSGTAVTLAEQILSQITSKKKLGE